MPMSSGSAGVFPRFAARPLPLDRRFAAAQDAGKGADGVEGTAILEEDIERALHPVSEEVCAFKSSAT